MDLLTDPVRCSAQWYTPRTLCVRCPIVQVKEEAVEEKEEKVKGKIEDEKDLQ